MTNNTTSTDILKACQHGISLWQQAFNRQDAAACAQQYTENAIMIARPFGTFQGREDIQAFWQKIIDDGFCDVNYTDVDWTQETKNTYILTSKWTMNKAFGVVHKEVWQVDADGLARLTDDDFEVLGER